jgi:hypothetical protein
MANVHKGLASLGVDLHEVGDLLALTNFLVQLHIIFEAPKRHLTNLGDTTLQKVIDVVVHDELLALVLQMIVSPTLKLYLTDVGAIMPPCVLKIVDINSFGTNMFAIAHRVECP